MVARRRAAMDAWAALPAGESAEAKVVPLNASLKARAGFRAWAGQKGQRTSPESRQRASLGLGALALIRQGRRITSL
jgi:hypothetical protein